MEWANKEHKARNEIPIYLLPDPLKIQYPHARALVNDIQTVMLFLGDRVVEQAQVLQFRK